MLRKITIFLAVSMLGLISGQDFYVPELDEMENINVEINGDLVFDLSINTNNHVSHKDTEVEYLKMTKNVDGILHYAIGARSSSDRLVASGGQNQTWASPHNVNIQLTYPATGVGAAVTYVAIVVNQTSNLGQAYIIKGGINQRMISIVVEAYNTYVFNVFAYVYGI